MSEYDNNSDIDDHNDHNDRRLIEDYLPIKDISAEASREKSIRKGHISTLHLWWARRPLVACRAAVYGALVPMSRFVPKNGPDNKKQNLGRANAKKFITQLCKYPGNPKIIKDAEQHILEAHAERLSAETGQKVTREDIEQGRVPRPKVLDMFAGGGAIPLETLRLGCEAYAIDLNPVAHIIELCTLVYPQKYGKPDSNMRGMTGLKNSKDEMTWGGLAEEVRYWGKWVLAKVREEIGAFYPPIPDPEYKGQKLEIEFRDGSWVEKKKITNSIKECIGTNIDPPRGYLTPIAYLWTRTVQCKNRSCGSTVPLVKQTWLCKKKGSYIALNVIAPNNAKEVYFEVVKTTNENKLGFDPVGFSKRGNAICPFCGTVADIKYIKDEGWEGRIGYQLMAVICSRPSLREKVYYSANNLALSAFSDYDIMGRVKSLCERTGLDIPYEPIANLPTDSKENSLGIRVRPYGLRAWGDLFNPRQLLFLLSLSSAIHEAEKTMLSIYSNQNHVVTNLTYLGLLLNRLAGFGNSLCGWNYHEQAVANIFGRQAIPMVWDFAEVGLLADMSGGIEGGLIRITDAINSIGSIRASGEVVRNTALHLHLPDKSIDAIITDPPYYDNIPYADLSDFYYVWLKRTIGHLYPEHFATVCTPKKQEAIADAHRHAGNKEQAMRIYELMMATAFSEAHRVLKSGGLMAIVYAHKTTLGWATLIDALRFAGFNITEAWPLDTEYSGRLRSQNSAALATSIFLVARKRDNTDIGNYEDDVKPLLEDIVHERVETLWQMGITGADLVIAAVGAGLRAFTRFARVEYANGEEVPAERFLAEVETIVLETILKRLSKTTGANGGQYNLTGMDPATRFYVLWRYTYKYSILDAGEAIVFANGIHVELDGPNGLSTGAKALLEKKQGKYRLKDYSDRGHDNKLGQKTEDNQPAPMIDVLHRTLWIMENHPADLSPFLQESQPNREQMRLVAQVLAGPVLKGGELAEVSSQAEMSALAKLTANWKSVIEDVILPVTDWEKK